MTALIVAAVALVVIAAMAFRMAQLYARLADLNHLVADMLRAPDLEAATRLAAAYAVRRVRERRRAR